MMASGFRWSPRVSSREATIPLCLPRTRYLLSALMLDWIPRTLGAMMSVLASFVRTCHDSLRSRTAIQIELLALRHQLSVLERSRPQRVRLTRLDRLFWVWLSRTWTNWRTTLVIVKPETVIAWHQQGFRLFWRWKSRRRTG